MADPSNKEHLYDDLMVDRVAAVLAIKEAIRSGDRRTKLFALGLAENDDFFSQDYYELIRELHRSPDQKVRYGVIGLLARYGDSGKRILLEMLADKKNDSNTRSVALDFLNRVQTPEENAASARAIAEEAGDALLRFRAAQILVRHGRNRDIAIKIARDCANTCAGTLRYEAIGFLGIIGTGGDLLALKRLMNDPSASPRLSRAARDAVRRLEWELLPSQHEKVERLKTLSTVAGPGKSWAIAMLDQLAKDGDKDASETLRKIASDPSHPARDFARARGYEQK